MSFFCVSHINLVLANAVRLCKEHKIVEELWKVASLANKRDKSECARYYENEKDYDRAIILYHQSGN